MSPGPDGAFLLSGEVVASARGDAGRPCRLQNSASGHQSMRSDESLSEPLMKNRFVL